MFAPSPHLLSATSAHLFPPATSAHLFPPATSGSPHVTRDYNDCSNLQALSTIKDLETCALRCGLLITENQLIRGDKRVSFVISLPLTVCVLFSRNDRFDLKLVGFCNPIQISGFNEFPLARSFLDIDYWFGIAKLGLIHENM
ncbi:unnamed protein product [Lactuca saligna]|uniref:Uncharacterized protein n=1 Tax=Lactuca saligna TaxID=75948 RepID=A0AA35YIC2_LACSI|nr:unnamed protein product [Lactuca saligna]